MTRVRRSLWMVIATIIAALGPIMIGPATPAAADALARGGAFLWLDNPSPPLNVAYTPSATYQYNITSPGGPINTVVRTDTGRYIVSFPNLDWDGVTHLTA